MELKTNYQYTYFIHPFVINENKYQKYLLKLLKDKRFNLKIFQRSKDVELYKFKTLVLYIDGKYIDIDLNLYDFDDDFKVVDEDSGETWFYRKIEIDLDN